MNGHTIYFHDDEFELIMLAAKRAKPKQTISEYVVWHLRNAPHTKLSVGRETAAEPKTAPEPEPSPSEALEDDKAA
jgi:hypothetical protein